ncbi:MAG: U32 family peptidase [Firmicutes bacterium]|nr:U32 family peptidase [Bacillota bacterium]
MKDKIELLAPAGDLERLKWALHYGADAVYIGGRDFSLRANATNFSVDEIKEACSYAHKLNKKVYVTINIVFHNKDFNNLENYIKDLEKCGVDAVIVSDLGCINIIKNVCPNMEIHISTQASTMNHKSATFYKELGASRVVLARECNKNEIKNIIDKTGIDTECFIHGAMCVGLSGRCVLSNYMTNRDSNRGGCSQICRWDFNLYDNNLNEIKNDTKFTMCSKDLSMIKYIGDMIDIGIKSFKIEGRMRSIYYIATVVNTYRKAIDEYTEKGTYDLNKYQKILNRVANRDNIDQFFDGNTGVEIQYYLGRQELSNQDFLGLVLEYDKDTKLATIEQRNYFKLGDTVEIFGPNTEIKKIKIEKIIDEDNNEIDVARHPKQIVKIPIDFNVNKNDIIRVQYL